MANWKYKLDLKDIWGKYDTGEMTVNEIGVEIANRIKKLPCYNDDDYFFELDDIATAFECVDNVEEFDYAMENLYNWGDIEWKPSKTIMKFKLCWIATNF